MFGGRIRRRQPFLSWNSMPNALANRANARGVIRLQTRPRHRGHPSGSAQARSILHSNWKSIQPHFVVQILSVQEIDQGQQRHISAHLSFLVRLPPAPRRSICCRGDGGRPFCCNCDSGVLQLLLISIIIVIIFFIVIFFSIVRTGQRGDARGDPSNAAPV